LEPRAAATEQATSYVLSGTATPLSTVRLRIDDGTDSTSVVTAETSPLGFYSVEVDPSELADGPLRITAVTTDLLGHSSQPATSAFLKGALSDRETPRMRHRLPPE